VALRANVSGPWIPITRSNLKRCRDVEGGALVLRAVYPKDAEVKFAESTRKIT